MIDIVSCCEPQASRVGPRSGERWRTSLNLANGPNPNKHFQDCQGSLFAAFVCVGCRNLEKRAMTPVTIHLLRGLPRISTTDSDRVCAKFIACLQVPVAWVAFPPTARESIVVTNKSTRLPAKPTPLTWTLRLIRLSGNLGASARPVHCRVTYPSVKNVPSWTSHRPK